MVFYVLFYGYWLILLSASGYCFLKGGWPERVGAGVMVAGSILSGLSQLVHDTHFEAVFPGVLLTDIVVAGAFVWLSLRSTRFWPIWCASLQLLAVASHFMPMFDPHIVRLAYAIVQGFWAYPMLGLMTWSARLHGRGVDIEARRPAAGR